MSSFNHYGCSFCGGPHNGGNCPGCSVIESGNGFVYDQNPYPYHETNDYFNQPPQHQYETYSCEFCGGNSHPGFDCQTGNTPVFDQGPCYNQDFGFNQPPHYSPSQPQQYPCCEICGNDAHYGYDCPPQVPFVYDQVPCYIQDYDEFPQTLPSFQQQILCCENCGGPHATFECQPMNQNFHDFGFDQFQPPQSPVIHQPPQEMSMEALQAREDLMKSIENFLKKFNRISFQKTPKVLMQAWDKFLEIKHAQSEDVQELLNKLVDDVRNVNEELAEYTNTPSWNLPNSSYDDDDDEESSIPLKDIIMSGLPPCVAITPDSPKTDSLIMEDEHLSTIPETESDEFIKSSVENLVPTPSESEDASNGQCDLPVCDDFPKSHLVTFSNPLFDIDDDCTSSDDESFSEEDVPMENFKIFSNPLFDLDEEIIATEVNLIQNEVLESITSIPPGIDSFDAESNLIESLLNRNTSIDSSSKIDSLLDEFAGELTLLKSIPSGIDDDNLDPEGEIHPVERLLYDNSSPRPPKDSNSDVSDTITPKLSHLTLIIFHLLVLLQNHRMLRFALTLSSIRP
ncbi:hypothetical protein Tco_1078784 [Tanacetum coccineum]|uniref:CCHC-type domain-containing protein n=1 Tax=Tanacetum coccineum TaxID=301880 RepID=A0ABQ5HRA8_9ASTR